MIRIQGMTLKAIQQSNGNVRANGRGITNPEMLSAMTGAIASNQPCT
ncbi:hypothetical protein [Nitrosomonas sp.]